MTRQAKTHKYRLTVTCRTYWRDGAHPDPGVVTHATREIKFRKLRVWEVEELGFGEAIRRAKIRQREHRRLLDEISFRRKYCSSPKVIYSPSENLERKGK